MDASNSPNYDQKAKNSGIKIFTLKIHNNYRKLKAMGNVTLVMDIYHIPGMDRWGIPIPNLIYQ